VVFQTSKFQTTQYANHVSLVSKPELTSLRRKDQLAGLLSWSIQMYVVRLGQGHVEEKNNLFIDDFSRMVWLGLMKHKDEAFKKFKSFKALAESKSDHKIKCLRSDRGGEFTSNEFFDFCEEHGIRMEFSTARTPQQNGVVERMNKTVQQMARAMLDESGTLATFWDEAAFVAVVISTKQLSE